MAQRFALATLTICSLVTLACLFIDHPLSAPLFGAAGLLFIPSLIALGAARRGRLGRLTIPLLLFGLYLLLTFGAMFLLSPEPDMERWWFGMPPATVLMLAGLWLAPLLAVSFGYAWHFKRSESAADER
jgi:hypothetical protein